MILVDTSIWVDHLRSTDALLVKLLGRNEVLAHPFVIGEIALGHLSRRQMILHDLSCLPRAKTATDDEVMAYIERKKLFGLGVGYIDAHLLAATALTTGARLWARDRRLNSAARNLGLAMP